MFGLGSGWSEIPSPSSDTLKLSSTFCDMPLYGSSLLWNVTRLSTVMSERFCLYPKLFLLTVSPKLDIL